MIATIMTGELDFADVLFLVGVILGVLSAILFSLAEPRSPARWGAVAGALAIAAVGFGLLAL